MISATSGGTARVKDMVPMKLTGIWPMEKTQSCGETEKLYYLQMLVQYPTKLVLDWMRLVVKIQTLSQTLSRAS